MSDLSSVIASCVVPIAIATPFVAKMVFRHLQEMAIINSESQHMPQLASDVQELKKQVADMRELMIDIALQPNTSAAMVQRLKQETSREDTTMSTRHQKLDV